VFVDNTNVTAWFSAGDNKQSKLYGNVTLTKKNDTEIELTFKSGKGNSSTYWWW